MTIFVNATGRFSLRAAGRLPLRRTGRRGPAAARLLSLPLDPRDADHAGTRGIVLERFVPLHDGHAAGRLGGDERLERRIAIPTLIFVEGHPGDFIKSGRWSPPSAFSRTAGPRGDGDCGRPEDVPSDAVAVPDDAHNRAVLSGRGRRHRRHGFMNGRVERAGRPHRFGVTPSPSSLDRNWRWTISMPLSNASGLRRGLMGRLDRLIEIVEHFEEVG